jgi:hypothetical protein
MSPLVRQCARPAQDHYLTRTANRAAHAVVRKEVLAMSVQQQEGSLGQTAETVYQVASAVIQVAPLVGKLWAIITGGVTNVKAWENRTSREIEVWKFDHGESRRKDEYRVGPGQTAFGDMWIPQTANSTEYPCKHAVVTVGGELLMVVYQFDGKVRFNTRDEFLPNGYTVPGAYAAGGDRRATFVENSDGVAVIFTKI